ncbi:MAG: hypothetical protein ACPGU1_00710 [Myxococcota bacterium]
MKPTVTAKDIALLEQHAELPSTEAILTRFGAYYEGCVGADEARSKAPVLPELPEPLADAPLEEPSEADISADEVTESPSDDQEDTVRSEAPEADLSDEDGTAAALEEAVEPEEGSEEEAPEEEAPEEAAEEEAPEEEAPEEVDNDTVVGLAAPSDEEIEAAEDGEASGTLMMAGLSDEAVAAAREQAEEGTEEQPVAAQDAETLITHAAPTTAHVEAVTEEAPAPKRKGRKSRKAKKKS